jgi:hypothetical protein
MELHFLLISDVLLFFNFRQQSRKLLTVQRSARLLSKRLPGKLPAFPKGEGIGGGLIQAEIRML